jgi:hypothetical protein
MHQQHDRETAQADVFHYKKNLRNTKARVLKKTVETYHSPVRVPAATALERLSAVVLEVPLLTRLAHQKAARHLDFPTGDQPWLSA